MPIASTDAFRRFARLEPSRRRLLVEAVVTLAAASVMLTVAPFRRAIRYGSVPVSPRALRIDDARWAIEAVARRLPWRIVCIQKGLALQRLVRRRGHDARLHYGIARKEDTQGLEAHVWVTLEGRALIGGEEAGRFAGVAVFPDA